MSLPSTRFSNARIDTLYEGCSADLQDPCLICFDDNTIQLSYDFDGVSAVYSGSYLAPGHYRLKSADGKGLATLHHLPGSRQMVGSWTESGERGVWRIDLNEPTES
jgi:hypothetical protein